MDKAKAEYKRLCVSRYFKWKDGLKKPLESSDPDAFIYWDESQNGKSCLDYDFDRNFRAGLFEQARMVLTKYTRRSINIAGVTFDIPTVVATAAGYQQVAKLSKLDYQIFLKSLERSNIAQATRIRIMGASRKEIKLMLSRVDVESDRAAKLAKKQGK